MNRHLHRLYRRTERVKFWFSSRFTMLGKLFLLIAIVSFFFGLNTQRTMIYQIFAVSSCALLFSFVISLRFSSKLSITRYLPESCLVGEVLLYRIRLINDGERAVKGLLFQESLDHYLPDWKEFASSREEGEEKRNAFDRMMGYYRWLWLLSIGRRMESKIQSLPDMLPGQVAMCDVSLMPLARGSVILRGYSLIKVDPLGLCKKHFNSGEIKKILIMPKLYRVADMRFQGARKYHQGGITLAQERGESNEFLSLREYTHGDPVKYIDWKSTARSGKTTVKQYRDEYFSRYGLVLDSFTSRRYCEIFEEAVSIAASIMMRQDNVNTVLDLLFVGGECLTCTMGSGLASQQRMLETLASVKTCRDKDFTEMTSLIKSHSALLSGVVLVLIDLDEDRKTAIRYLASHRIPTKVILVVRNAEEFGAKQDTSLGVPVHMVEYKHVEEQINQL